MTARRTSSAVTSFPATVAVVSLGVFSVLVAYLQLSWTTVVLLLPVPILITYAVARAAMGMPATIKGNALSPRYEGRRYQLVAMPVNHFGERLRWCMDLIGARYEESTVAGILSIFARGRTVPWLVDRQSCSRIGNSDEAMWYLSVVHVPEMTGPAHERAARLLSRDADTMAWEGRLNALGHAIQGWAYYSFLAPGADREHPLRMWGAMEGHVPALQRWVLRLGYPVFKALMRKAFNLDDTAAHQKRYAIIQSMFDDVDAALEASGGTHIMGPHLSYVDISFCALVGPLMPSTVLPHWANGRFESFKPLVDSTFPDELTKLEQELRARPCGRYVEEMFSQWRHRSFDDGSAGPAPGPERDLASP